MRSVLGGQPPCPCAAGITAGARARRSGQGFCGTTTRACAGGAHRLGGALAEAIELQGIGGYPAPIGHHVVSPVLYFGQWPRNTAQIRRPEDDRRGRDGDVETKEAVWNIKSCHGVVFFCTIVPNCRTFCRTEANMMQALINGYVTLAIAVTPVGLFAWAWINFKTGLKTLRWVRIEGEVVSSSIEQSGTTIEFDHPTYRTSAIVRNEVNGCTYRTSNVDDFVGIV